VDYLCQTGHYFVLASKRTLASESKPLFGEGYICQRTREFDQRRESGPRKLVKVAPRVALTAWSRPTMTWRAESGSRRNRKNLYVPRGLISSDSDKRPVPHRQRLLNLQRGLGRSARRNRLNLSGSRSIRCSALSGRGGQIKPAIVGAGCSNRYIPRVASDGSAPAPAESRAAQVSTWSVTDGVDPTESTSGPG
jgi:hypothetical protein